MNFRLLVLAALLGSAGLSAQQVTTCAEAERRFKPGRAIKGDVSTFVGRRDRGANVWRYTLQGGCVATFTFSGGILRDLSTSYAMDDTESIAAAFQALSAQVRQLESRVRELEGRLESPKQFHQPVVLITPGTQGRTSGIGGLQGLMEQLDKDDLELLMKVIRMLL